MSADPARRCFHPAGRLLACVVLFGAHAAAFAAPDDAARCAERNPQRAVWFGDLHVHTAFSLDAATQDTRNTPDDAYRFAKGETIQLQPYDDDGKGLRELQLRRPLDFAAVTDHAELLGETAICGTPGMAGHYSWTCLMYRHLPKIAFMAMNRRASVPGNARYGFCGDDDARCLAAASARWKTIRDAAERHDDRSAACAFTSLIGYEWTGSDQVNLHRNVIFSSAAVPERAISFVDEPTPEGLWARLDTQCERAGPDCDYLSIPHNANLSGGQMFTSRRADGQPMGRAHAERLRRRERVVEIMQHKGSSECYYGPQDSSDELCAFEQLPYDTFVGKFSAALGQAPMPDTGFARQTLNLGLSQRRRLGINPYKHGFIGSTDSHLAAAGAVAESADYPGHGGAGASGRDVASASLPDDLEFNPGGLAAIWAESNSRASLFAALKRREVYGTSGPRIRLRFFGGWGYAPAAQSAHGAQHAQGAQRAQGLSVADDGESLCGRRDFAQRGYQGGVPMGGTLMPSSLAEEPVAPPRFAVWAMRDDAGGALQRLQIIKGWLDAGGRTHEQVHDVAGDSEAAAVDMSTCQASGAGHDQLCTVWRDPAFDAQRPAWYYVRALEQPSCRWSARICMRQRVDCANPDSVPDGLQPCCAANHRRTVQERAWSSPIWYEP